MTERRLSPVYGSEDRMYEECKSCGGGTNLPHKRAFCATGPRQLITSTQPTREREGEQNISEYIASSFGGVTMCPTVFCTVLQFIIFFFIMIAILSFLFSE